MNLKNFFAELKGRNVYKFGDGELMLDERWDPLRKEPRFEKLLLSLPPK